MGAPDGRTCGLTHLLYPTFERSFWERGPEWWDPTPILAHYSNPTKIHHHGGNHPTKKVWFAMAPTAARIILIVPCVPCYPCKNYPPWSVWMGSPHWHWHQHKHQHRTTICQASSSFCYQNFPCYVRAMQIGQIWAVWSIGWSRYCDWSSLVHFQWTSVPSQWTRAMSPGAWPWQMEPEAG